MCTWAIAMCPFLYEVAWLIFSEQTWSCHLPTSTNCLTIITNPYAHKGHRVVAFFAAELS